MKRQTLLCTAAAVGILILILDADTALSGAREGVELCVRTIVPTLLPFCVLSALLLGNMGNGAVARRLCGMMGIPRGCEALLVIALVGGYPVGAQSVAQLHRDGKIGKDTANRLLAFCSNAGPSFLFGIIAPKFSSLKMCWALWAIHALSAVAVGLFLPEKSEQQVQPMQNGEIRFSQALNQSIRVLASVCGCIVLFRTVIAFLQAWFLALLPTAVQVAVMGFWELTNGCCALDMIESETARFVVCACLLSFGGVCVAMQTAAVIGDLSIRSYLKGKLLQTAISFTLAWLSVRSGGLGLMILAFVAVFCHEFKKRSSQRAALGV